ncbi:MAG: isoprenylcysteine carboxylmethyltransferase family protein [Alistipes sp.]|jgi:protein-S-isoprenylcysteine O-methyltransferase Ste14|nr:isoprenylcysteine carboxylmethyltransferase family protein [Alistipes sp.]
MILFRILGLVIVALFYAIYLQRQFALRRRGIRADRLGKGQKERTTRTVERALLAVTLSMPVAQVASVVWGRGADVVCVQALHFTPGGALCMSVSGAAVALGGVVFFLLAVVAMRDNWRAGIDREQKTSLVTSGVYRVSRNPAFVGFDLFYVGIAAMFPNPVLIVLTLAGLVGFHLQILQEERYAPGAFGQAYLDYARKTRRYL